MTEDESQKQPENDRKPSSPSPESGEREGEGEQKSSLKIPATHPGEQPADGDLEVGIYPLPDDVQAKLNEDAPEPAPAPSPVEQSNPSANLDQNPGIEPERQPDTPKVMVGAVPMPAPAPPSSPPPVEDSEIAEFNRPLPRPADSAEDAGSGTGKSFAFSQATSDLAEAARSRFDKIRETGQKVAAEQKEKLHVKGDHLRLDLEHKAERFNRAAVDAVDGAWVKAGDYRKRGEEAFRKEPVKGLGVALAAGFLIALLFTGRRR